MPKVSFYLRNEDIEKWKLIDKKTQFMHEMLNTKETVLRILDDKIDKAKREFIADATIKLPETVDGLAFLNEPTTKPKTRVDWCKQHDMEKEYCRNMKHK